MEPAGHRPEEILKALRRLDVVLQRAVDVARAVFGPEAVADPFKGLHVSAAEVTNLLARSPAGPLVGTNATRDDADPPHFGNASTLGWLQRTFGLSPFDADVVVIAVAPELDLRYERIYSFLQNDVTRRRPSVDLVLRLLCQSITDNLECRVRFAPDSPLVRHGLIDLVPDPHHVRPPLLAHAIKLDDQIVRLLLGETSLDPRLVHCCESQICAVSIDDLALDETVKRSLRTVASEIADLPKPAQLYLQGPFAVDKRRLAEAVATIVGSPLLAVDLARVLSGDSIDRTLRLVFRQAWLQNAVLYLHNLDAVRGEDRRHECDVVLENLATRTGVTLLSGTQPWMLAGHAPIRVITLPIGVPDAIQRRRQWRASLHANGIVVADRDLDTLSARFRLAPSQIAQAVLLARERARWQRAQPGLNDLCAAARDQCRHDLAVLTRKIEPKYEWADIVLPEDSLAQLREICQREVHRHCVMDVWGFDSKLSSGKGVNALFSGPSGTGKTMAAEIIANELELDLYKIDLAGVVSKYIGETEKNLDRIFTSVENAILFFDEADALFGKRSEVRDSHDRYANLEISYLLQKMEQYEGVAILATNLRQNLDDAFVRRLAFTVHFPFPDEAHRRRIWQRIWPPALPLAPDVDIEFLAARFKLSGGNIKNIALASAFLAAADGGIVTMDHLRHATQREYQKLGKMLSAAELYGAAHEAAS